MLSYLLYYHAYILSTLWLLKLQLEYSSANKLVIFTCSFGTQWEQSKKNQKHSTVVKEQELVAKIKKGNASKDECMKSIPNSNLNTCASVDMNESAA